MNRINLINADKNIFNINMSTHIDSNQEKKVNFTNYFMTIEDKPFYGISGEFHFSRYEHTQWEDEIIKIKMCGINIIPTYIIWNHHEEMKGVYNWNDNLNINKFISLCAKHDLYVIIRIGPFCHGEIRNGGFPDWLYGEPCRVRSNDPDYLKLVDRLYGEIGQQVKGFFIKDGGPIIGVQLENEFGHSSAPWEITTGTSNEWCTTGEDGYEHIDELKRIALKHDINPAFYTGTGWGGSFARPDQVLPLWGGYAYWPWIFYGDVSEHPLTPEFIYRDFHNNEIGSTYNFEPLYEPEQVPYACCEMAGGMTVFYNYRFQLPYKSIDAMSNIKIAGGCNLLGYYVFHGGSNPTGKLTPYLNETVTPKISYDYQAAIGEFGQVRESYKRLKRLHYFLNTYSEEFCSMKTFLPENSQSINPDDLETIRFAVRAKEDRGFLFINNFQDHIENINKDNFDINIDLRDGQLALKGLSLKKEENCILPFNFKMGSTTLRYATCQLITHIFQNGVNKYLFFTPDGMPGEYYFKRESIFTDAVTNNISDDLIAISGSVPFKFHDLENNQFEIITLSENESENLWVFDFEGQKQVIITNAVVLAEKDKVRFESDSNVIDICTLINLPCTSIIQKLEQSGDKKTVGERVYYKLSKDAINIGIEKQFSNNGKHCRLSIDSNALQLIKDARLHIKYLGDIGYSFINNKLIHDNYHNGDDWVIGLKKHLLPLSEHEIFLKISPVREGKHVKTDSPMAARSESAVSEIAEFVEIRVQPVYEFTL
ncbi:beta-galactosidase [Buttiauxella massiliensis]|uniref:beta-galactosidase n=1 Tax=Buttiauxella massiliensis TaxID=2831590 RepID=UPI00125FFC82|nr:beta-galactosidase [Buttiauxella massiliensis]